MKSRFYWVGMAGDIEKYIKNCPRCIRRKAQGKTAATLVVVDSTYPMDLVCMDFVSLEMSAGGYEHILIMIDNFTLRPSFHETKQPRPQPDFYLTILFAIMGSLLASTVTKVATSKARLLRSCAPLPMWIRHGLLLIILMGNGMPERFN